MHSPSDRSANAYPPYTAAHLQQWQGQPTQAAGQQAHAGVAPQTYGSYGHSSPDRPGWGQPQPVPQGTQVSQQLNQPLPMLPPQRLAQPDRQPAADPLTEADLSEASETISRIAVAFSDKVVGQRRLGESLLVGLICGGHVLLESVPGLAKTTAAETIAAAVDGSFNRIQCTPDLLPSDIIGSQIYDARTGEFRTQLGPVHANIVLLDEINRSSAKTQSAMLESMQERQTTIGGEEYPLPKPFMVIATQNPIEQEGTYVLAEAQLDRFMLKDVLDYPTPAEEAEVLRRIDEGRFTAEPKPVATLDDVQQLQELVKRVYIDPAITEYIVSITYVTRHIEQYLPPELARLLEVGVSPRAAIALSAGARALALIEGSAQVLPEHVRSIAPRVLRHRLVLSYEAAATGVTADHYVDAVLGAIRTP